MKNPDLMIRILDQREPKSKYLYANLSNEEFQRIIELLNVQEEDWD